MIDNPFTTAHNGPSGAHPCLSCLTAGGYKLVSVHCFNMKAYENKSIRTSNRKMRLRVLVCYICIYIIYDMGGFLK